MEKLGYNTIDAAFSGLVKFAGEFCIEPVQDWYSAYSFHAKEFQRAMVDTCSAPHRHHQKQTGYKELGDANISLTPLCRISNPVSPYPMQPLALDRPPQAQITEDKIKEKRKIPTPVIIEVYFLFLLHHNIHTSTFL